ncbi:GntR family transcriptional regulator [Catellatospora sp. TT07R-123]|uniref:GntR family transcriptional regulator n=1 Tax=Catellatospora sp. TT07R-123 TaxID=2733863 RepID=UPI001B1FDB00|nr:GntR family transcriptional regulator [Catellatospora sp. TT07R-123]GHJ47234.1 GntR family transcriptional regulator [Catellatospora sp. TT07R-123]
MSASIYQAGVPAHGRVPKYYAVKALLLDEIATLGVGAPLPPERDLAARYGVGRSTVRQAISELTIEGRLSAQQGRGTFVAKPKLIQPLSLVSYTESLRGMGYQPGRIVITLDEIAADEELAGELEIAPGEPVIHLERVLLADGEPLGLESTYLPADRFPTLLEVLDPTGSLYKCMQDELGVVWAEATERIETALASPREALLLQTNPALPMLLMQRLSRDPGGVPIERVRALYRGDRIGFQARLITER